MIDWLRTVENVLKNANLLNLFKSWLCDLLLLNDRELLFTSNFNDLRAVLRAVLDVGDILGMLDIAKRVYDIGGTHFESDTAFECSLTLGERCEICKFLSYRSKHLILSFFLDLILLFFIYSDSMRGYCIESAWFNGSCLTNKLAVGGGG